MDEELFLGIPGIDIPYPKYVQDALDLVARETRRYTTLDRAELRQLWHDDVTRQRHTSPKPDTKFWETRRAQKAAQQKKRPYQPVDYADQWPSW